MPKKKNHQPKGSAASAPVSPTHTISEVSEWLLTAQKHFDEGAYSEAIADCSFIIDQQKRNPAAYLLRSKAYQKTGEISKALHDCDICVYQRPKNNPEAYFLSAELNLSNGNCSKAIDDCERAIEQKPDNPRAYFLLGETKVTLENYVEAIPEFSTAIEQKPDNPDAYRMRGYAFRKNGQNEEAIADFTMSISQQPENPYAYLGRAEVHTINGDYQAAIDDLTMAIAQRPESSSAYFRRGEAYLLSNRYQEAFDDFEASVNLREWNPSAYLRIGEIHLMHSRFQDAIAAFSNSITHQGKSPNSAFEALVPKHPTEQYANVGRASDAFYARVHNAIYSPSAYYGRGVTHLMIWEYAKAEADFTSSIEVQKRNPYAYLRRAQARHSLYGIELQNAENQFEAKDNTPKVPSNDNPKNAAKEKLRKAKEDCDTSLYQLPNNPETYFVRSNVNRFLEKYEDAYRDQLKAHSLGVPGLYYNILYLRDLSVDQYKFDLNELLLANSPNMRSSASVAALQTPASTATNLASTTLASVPLVQGANVEVSQVERATTPKHTDQVETSRGETPLTKVQAAI